MALDKVSQKVRQLHEAVMSGMVAGPIAMMGRKQLSQPIQAERMRQPHPWGAETDVVVATVEFEVERAGGGAGLSFSAERLLQRALDQASDLLNATIVSVEKKGA